MGLALLALGFLCIRPAQAQSGYSGGGGYGYWDTTGGERTTIFSVVVDTDPNPRSVTITSSIDPTYHKGKDNSGNPAPVLDDPGTATSVKPEQRLFSQPLPIDYFVHASGGWANGSSYLLHCSSGDPANGSNSGNTVSGQFSLPSDPICDLIMQYGSSATTEHAHAHLTGAKDEANATADYNVTFYKAVDGWNRASMIYHPLPAGGPTDTTNIGEWQVYGSFPNNNPPGTPANTTSCAVGNQETFTITGTIGGQQTTTATGADVSQAFQTNESISVSQSYQSSTTQTYVAQIPTGGISYVYWGKGWTDRSGNCDLYDAHGYKSTVPWDASVANVDPQGNLVILWATKFIPSPPP